MIPLHRMLLKGPEPEKTDYFLFSLVDFWRI